MHYLSRPRALLRTLGVGLLSASGCNLLIPFTFLGEHKRTVPAEFDKLSGKRVLVLVWAEDETRYDYPHIRLELASYVGDQIRAHVKNCDTVDPASVEDFMQRELDAAVDPVRTGKKFNADMVVYVELLQFQMRDPSAVDLLRARVKASVVVHDLSADPDQPGRYKLSSVDVVYPANHPVLMSSQNALLVRQQTYEQFAEKVARMFYEHQVDL